MPENVTTQKTSQETSHEGPAGHPLDHSADAAPARQLTRPGDSSPAMPTGGRRSMAPPALALAGTAPGGLPMQLKLGIESLTGVSMDGVRVVHGSSAPARYGAGAFARKGEIHLGPGHADKLDHEAWHIAQQRLGKVHKTRDLEGQAFNDDADLEAEADRMGALARQHAAQAAGGALQQGADVDVMQFAPGDFALHPILAVQGLGGTFSHWRDLLDQIRAYALVDPLNNVLRLQGLRAMQAAAKAWREQIGFVGIDPNTLLPERRLQGIHLISFERRLMAEWQDASTQAGQFAQSTGSLNSDQGLEALPNPEITRKRLGTTFIGFFNPGARLTKRDNTFIPDPIPGTGCKLIENGTAPLNRQAGDYYAVEAYGKVKQLGQAAKIENGVFFKDDVWVRRTHITAANDLEPNDLHQYVDQSDPVLHPLFAHAPTLADVQQNGLGDCWLLAAVTAVVSDTPNHFVTHMKDNMDGTVSVKLYDHDPNAVGNQYPERIVTVEKSTIQRKSDGGDAFAGGSLWVKIYEKAFAAAGFHGKDSKTLPIEKGSMGLLEGGQSANAFKHILGRNAQSIYIDETRPSITNGDISRILDHPGHGLLRPEISQVYLYLNNLWGTALDVLLNSKVQPRRAEFQPLIDQALLNPPPHIAAEVNQFVTWLANAYFPGKRGSGVYAEWQLHAFDQMIQQFDAGQLVTASTKDTIVSNTNNQGGLSREHVGKGLAGPHAYVVIDYHPQPFALPLPPNQLCWVKLRNPWGDVKTRKPDAPDPGRVYRDKNTNELLDTPYDAPRVDGNQDLNPIGAEGTDDPEFWVELSDIGKRFTRFDHTA